MSGQLGFQATDPVPPMNGWIFAGEDVDELGLELCVKVAERIQPKQARIDDAEDAQADPGKVV